MTCHRARIASNPATAPKIIDLAQPHPIFGKSLGPNQLRWLRSNIPEFAKAEQDVIRANENAARVLAEIGLQPIFIS